MVNVMLCEKQSNLIFFKKQSSVLTCCGLCFLILKKSLKKSLAVSVLVIRIYTGVHFNNVIFDNVHFNCNE